jgi:drug/metabolite transporter (DMT)-like permease
MAILLALLTSVAFGTSDVAGAVATRRSTATAVAIGMLLAGGLALVPAVLLLPGTPSARALGLGALAGVAGSTSLLVYLRALAIGPIGVISPIAAVIGVAVPVTVGVVVAGDVLGLGQRAGIVMGMVAVVAVAYVPGSSIRSAGSRGPIAAVLAGVGFGLFVVALDATPADSGLWPVVGARLSGLIPVVVFAVSTGRSMVLARSAVPLAIVAGVLDVTANVTLLLATRSGLLSLVALLSSLYPVVALLTARVFLHERLRRSQLAGVAAAMVAVGLLVAS